MEPVEEVSRIWSRACEKEEGMRVILDGNCPVWKLRRGRRCVPDRDLGSEKEMAVSDV